MKISELQRSVHQLAVEKGWYSQERSFGELIALCHSELSEALEEYRKRELENNPIFKCPHCDSNFLPDEDFASDEVFCLCGMTYDPKPEGVKYELADAVIRILDMAEFYKIDLESAILEKHEFNKTRSHRHGGKLL